MTRAFQWATLVLATLVVIGVVLQVYFIAVYMLSLLDGAANTDALDIHEGLGGAVHGVEILTFLAAIGAFWKRWGLIGLAFSLPVVGTIQLGVVEADDEWASGLHGLLALFVMVIASIVAHRAMHDLGMGRRRTPGAPGVRRRPMPRSCIARWATIDAMTITNRASRPWRPLAHSSSASTTPSWIVPTTGSEKASPMRPHRFQKAPIAARNVRISTPWTAPPSPSWMSSASVLAAPSSRLSMYTAMKYTCRTTPITTRVARTRVAHWKARVMARQFYFGPRGPCPRGWRTRGARRCRACA